MYRTLESNLLHCIYQSHVLGLAIYLRISLDFLLLCMSRLWMLTKNSLINTALFNLFRIKCRFRPNILAATCIVYVKTISIQSIPRPWRATVVLGKRSFEVEKLENSSLPNALTHGKNTKVTHCGRPLAPFEGTILGKFPFSLSQRPGIVGYSSPKQIMANCYRHNL